MKSIRTNLLTKYFVSSAVSVRKAIINFIPHLGFTQQIALIDSNGNLLRDSSFPKDKPDDQSQLTSSSHTNFYAACVLGTISACRVAALPFGNGRCHSSNS